ncbi:hypothetical protein PHJA_000025200, partial [Phtheirospermum japonicum]
NLEVDYESDEIASIVYATLAFDKELHPDKVRRQMSVSNGKLSVNFEAFEARFLRVSYSAFEARFFVFRYYVTIYNNILLFFSL